MEKNKQQIEGNNNVQIGVNHGDIIQTNKLIRKTEVIYDDNVYISDAQAVEIRNRIQKLAEERAGENKYSSPPYKSVYSQLYRKYKITKYTLLPKAKYEDAIKWLDRQIAIYRPKLKNINPEQYRKEMYKSIHARANKLEIKDRLYQIINEILKPKNPISSLKQLSDTQLNIVYKKIFSMK